MSCCGSCVQELFRISKENCDFKVTAGPSTSGDDKGSSGGDSGGNSPPAPSPGRAPAKKTSEYKPTCDPSVSRTEAVAPEMK